jgi:hypothetical protein
LTEFDNHFPPLASVLTAIFGGFDKKENTLAFMPGVNQHPQPYHSEKIQNSRVCHFAPIQGL